MLRSTVDYSSLGLGYMWVHAVVMVKLFDLIIFNNFCGSNNAFLYYFFSLLLAIVYVNYYNNIIFFTLPPAIVHISIF